MQEPPPRDGHYSAPVRGMLYLWGGRTNDEPASFVHVFDPAQETWKIKRTEGLPPPGLYAGACCTKGHLFYVFGGIDRQKYYNNCLHQLDTRTLSWTQLAGGGPLKKHSCGMLAHGDKLLLFGGYGILSGLGQLEMSLEFRSFSNSGWTNELHSFDLKKCES